MIDDDARRLLLVHAHPDDETLNNALTMAAAVRDGVAVTLVTCTLGEFGEVVVDDLVHLDAQHTDRLGPHRLGELAAATRALGVQDTLRLGGDFAHHDSGMVWGEDGLAHLPDDAPEDAFARADLGAVADELVAVLRERRPHVVITYDPLGGYHHPDHVQAHRATTLAVMLAAVASHRPDLGAAWATPRVLWSAMAESTARAAISALRSAGDVDSFRGAAPDAPLPPVVAADDLLDVVVTEPDLVAAKAAAFAAHRSQLRPDRDWPAVAALDTSLDTSLAATEAYRWGGGFGPPPRRGGEPAATDLFAGLA